MFHHLMNVRNEIMKLGINEFHYIRWQARREHDRSMRAGLIPSRALQERRILEERKILMAAKAREFEGRKKGQLS